MKEEETPTKRRSKTTNAIPALLHALRYQLVQGSIIFGSKLPTYAGIIYHFVKAGITIVFLLLLLLFVGVSSSFSFMNLLFSLLLL